LHFDAPETEEASSFVVTDPWAEAAKVADRDRRSPASWHHHRASEQAHFPFAMMVDAKT
jgi:hypothetical protein